MSGELLGRREALAGLISLGVVSPCTAWAESTRAQVALKVRGWSCDG